MKPFTQVSLTLALALAPCFATRPAAAQEPGRERAAEVAELEALLAKVEAAIARTAPLLEVELVQYDVRHLQWRPVDRLPPRLSLPNEAAGWRSGAEGGYTFEDEVAGEGVVIEVDWLEQVVTGVIGGRRAWDDPRAIQFDDGYLLVWQTRANHARIARLLAQLAAKETRAVQLEVQFYALPADLQTQLEQAARAEDGVLDPEVLARLDGAVEEDPKRLAGSALLTGLDHQRLFLHEGAERTYVAGYERSSGGTGEAVATVDDPVVETLVTGMALDVHASILDGQPARVALDVRFNRTRTTGLTQRLTAWGPIDIPTVAVDTVRTSARVPDGAGMLVFSTRGSQDPAQPDVTIVVRPRIVGP